MKLLAALVLSLFVFASADALAADQNFFLKKHLNKSVQEPVRPEAKDNLKTTVPPLTSGAKGDAAVAPAIPTNGRTPITNDQANSYYTNCLTQKSSSFTQNGQQMMCACTAAQMQQEMSVEDVQLMGQDTPEGQAMRDKMTLFVYAPCMKYPTHDLIYTRCMADPQLKAAVKNQEGLCKCMGDGMADFIEERGPEQLVASLRQTPGDLDPLGTLMNSPAFNSQAQTVMQACAPQGQ